MKIHFDADDVRLNVSKDAKGQFVPSLASARNGSVLVQLAKAEIESALLTFARAAAAEQGAQVDSAELALTSLGDRSVEASVRVKARKIMAATVTVTGRADVDEQLNVRVSDLGCRGEGMVGTMIAGVLGAKLKAYDGREFALAGEYLKNVRVQGLKLDAGDPVRVTAAFES